ncbi:Spo0B domain-containing protein [Alicyclobacillus dauci]|uniref:Spo0B domain-containing protein n=1 Tax=Alicyclobacillus dauci TaxID=1475485 RepID=A0ABY6ZA50_9BACL|nr:Spo0B domain-containing protein [Alicyclobacillus dauci]WAH38975.1 Spo0B domain-containing protein [Alicyclobacillus dauci]
MLDADSTTNEATSFRRHRHDVLNELQLVRGYLQMNQPEKAVRVVDRTAEWLQSLTRWQVSLDGVGEELMWVACMCPNVVLNAIKATEVPSPQILHSMKRWLSDVQVFLAEHGLRLHISVRVDTHIYIRIAENDLPVSYADWENDYLGLQFTAFKDACDG